MAKAKPNTLEDDVKVILQGKNKTKKLLDDTFLNKYNINLNSLQKDNLKRTLVDIVGRHDSDDEKVAAVVSALTKLKPKQQSSAITRIAMWTFATAIAATAINFGYRLYQNYENEDRLENAYNATIQDISNILGLLNAEVVRPLKDIAHNNMPEALKEAKVSDVQNYLGKKLEAAQNYFTCEKFPNVCKLLSTNNNSQVLDL